jgi:hypothetical protein
MSIINETDGSISRIEMAREKVHRLSNMQRNENTILFFSVWHSKHVVNCCKRRTALQIRLCQLSKHITICFINPNKIIQE